MRGCATITQNEGKVVGSGAMYKTTVMKCILVAVGRTHACAHARTHARTHAHTHTRHTLFKHN